MCWKRFASFSLAFILFGGVSHADGSPSQAQVERFAAKISERGFGKASAQNLSWPVLVTDFWGYSVICAIANLPRVGLMPAYMTLEDWVWQDEDRAVLPYLEATETQPIREFFMRNFLASGCAHHLLQASALKAYYPDNAEMRQWLQALDAGKN